MELTGNLLVTNVENYPRFFKNEDKKFLSEMNEETARILRNDKDFSVNFTSVEKKIAEFFNNPPLFLEITPEKDFLLLIGIKDTPENALKKLREFDADWWIDNEEMTLGKLCVDVICI